MNNYATLFFAIAAGATASGIIANLYRLAAKRSQSKLGTILHCAVMIFAGPVVLAGNSTKAFRKKDCSMAAYGLALALSAYWSFAMGLFILSVCVAR
jgi:hypothetical protein